MAEKIIIVSRSDNVAAVPQISIRSRSNNKNATQMYETVRNHLLRRHNSFELRLTTSEARSYTESYNDLPFFLVNRACSYKKPFIYNDYDYLRRSVRKIACKIMYNASQVTINYEIEYLTTLSQEDQIDRVLQALFKEKDAYKIQYDFQKIKFAYDFIIANVQYDKSLTKHSAYDALIGKSAVCEGCANLLYRILSMFGIPCRIVTGKGLRESHAWNIVRLNGKWYNMDVTWDLYKSAIERNLSLYSYFLKGSDTFHDHVRDLEYATSEFVSKHPMSNIDFQPQRRFKDLFRFK